MESKNKTQVTVSATVNAPIDHVWKLWTAPVHVCRWNQASDDWHTPRAENDLRAGGSFIYRMEARDGSFGFDFGGTYERVTENELIEYSMSDGRNVRVTFQQEGDAVRITETFDAEDENPVEMQRDGWQAILDNFRKYAEATFAAGA
jgi:uncharacterized protein YndB with AHSA1/START domain